jgi:hypothetical protein
MTTEPEQWAAAYLRPFFNQMLEGFRAYFLVAMPSCLDE